MFNHPRIRLCRVCATLMGMVLLVSCRESDPATEQPAGTTITAITTAVTPTELDRVRTHLTQHRIEAAALDASPDATWDDFLALCDRTWTTLRAAGLEPVRLSPDAIALLYQARLVHFPSDERDEALTRLESLASGDDEVAAGASVLRLEFLGSPFAARVDGEWIAHVPDDTQQADLLEGALFHDAIADAVRNGSPAALMLPATISGLDRPDLLSEHRDAILALAAWYSEDADPRVFLTMEDYLEAIDTLTPSLTPAETEAIRTRMVAAARIAVGGADAMKASLNEDEIDWLVGTVERLEGAAARNELLGHPAPDLEILWSSTGEWTSLDDLAGHVVVLDFWTTWCAPCIASFPRLRDLQARYADSPVVILGVTSPQGRHVVDGEVVDCRDDPQREFALMDTYIRERDITWPIMFTREDVYNPDYGVSGIPHVAIIDRDGIVRHRGLHASDFDDICDAIDALLK